MFIYLVDLDFVQKCSRHEYDGADRVLFGEHDQVHAESHGARLETVAKLANILLC
mgnify:CR=1 FL=1